MRESLTDTHPARPHERGAAVVELGFIVPVLLVMLLAAIDMGRLVYMNQLSTDLTRAAATMGARGFTEQEAINAAHAADFGLDLEEVGIVFVSTIKRKDFDDPTPWIVSQTQDGSLQGVTSEVGNPGGPATLPEISSLDPGMKLTAVEVAVPFEPLFPLEGLGLDLYPSVIYEVAYF